MEKTLRFWYIISAWASALLVQLFRAMRRPQFVGRVTGTVPHAFLVPYATFAIHLYSVGESAVLPTEMYL